MDQKTALPDKLDAVVDASSTWLTMADGQPLFVRDWPRQEARGTVLMVHGLGEHSGRYQRLAQWFHRRGYGVRSYDQRGHGRSPGPRGALRHRDDLLTDLATVYQSYAADQAVAPLLLGHSMGGLVVARAVLDGRVEPSGMLLSSPALRSWTAEPLRNLARALSHVVPGLPMHNGLKVEKLSHDNEVVEAYCNDPLCSSRITPRLADFIFRAGSACIADASSLRVPSLLLVADSDELVDPSGSREFSRVAASTGQLTTRFFSMLYHELFNETEPGRGQVLMQVADWLHKNG